MFSITVEFTPDVDFYDCYEKAVVLAKQNHVPVNYTFNGVNLLVREDTLYSKIDSMYELLKGK